MILDSLLLDRLTPAQRKALRQWRRRVTKPARLGTLHRTSPLSERYGSDRGTPVDRYYIERFLNGNRADIHGRVLEIKEPLYITRFGVNISQADVLDIDPGNPKATFVCDLAAADAVPSGIFDCFVLTQTLQMLYDLRAAVFHAHRILKPGGVLLVTVPVTSRIIPGEGLDMDYWRFTAASCRRLFGDVFGAINVQVQSHGNVLTSIAFLAGMSYEELAQEERDVTDPYFPLLISVRAVKA